MSSSFENFLHPAKESITSDISLTNVYDMGNMELDSLLECSTTVFSAVLNKDPGNLSSEIFLGQ